VKNIFRLLIVNSLFALSTVYSTGPSITIPDFNNWWTFVDKLGTGSQIKPDKYFVTDEENIEVTITKADQPEWKEQAPQSDYPYVGIGTYFEPSKTTVDLSGVESICLIYKLDGPVSLVLSQSGIDPGDEYITDLPPAENYTKFIITWSDFYQPHWVNKNSRLDISKLTGIRFEIRTRYKSSATLGIHSVTFKDIIQ